jgi:predicted nucleic acid-binding protein
MTSLIVDSWAWVEYFRGTESGASVKQHLEKGETLTHSVTIAEVISKLQRVGFDLAAAKQAFAVIPRVIEAERDSAVAVGGVHAEMRKKVPNFSLADAFVLQAARKLGAKVLTGDPDFRGTKEAEFIG